MYVHICLGAQVWNPWPFAVASSLVGFTNKNAMQSASPILALSQNHSNKGCGL